VAENPMVQVVVHGHFYQPPRENPWIGMIEEQESAEPFHDWNERIAFECYGPNAQSRILDQEGRLVDMVNNFEYLSFNIGPTLFSWLEKNTPETYHQILEGDRKSALRLGGHGNAIAQVFNHIIMPLASLADQRVQVRWGVADFQRRFGRAPRGIWLAETACNIRTLELLREEKLQFTILSPWQAARIRPIDADGRPMGEWQDVTQTGLSPAIPYRHFFGKNRNHYLDLFFFDQPLSTAISFEGLLNSADDLAHRLLEVGRGYRLPEGHTDRLVLAATDGETFGHHHPFADMCLAYFFTRKAQERNIQIVNLSYVLAKNPPRFEVEVKDGEGTAWSCHHGVGRWCRDCGCSTGGQAGWNQAWRTPLRESFDWLKERIDALTEPALSRGFKNPEAALEDYVSVLFEESLEARSAFLRRHFAGDADQAIRRALDKTDLEEGSVSEEVNVSDLFRALEARRYAQYMYTSCGWFFSELSGLETTQCLRYAAAALGLVKGFSTDPDLEEAFLSRLERAQSNIHEFGNGRNIYQKFVLPSVYAFRRALNQFVLGRLFLDEKEIPLPPLHAVETVETYEGFGGAESATECGLLRVRHERTWETRHYLYHITHQTARDAILYLKQVDGRKVATVFVEKLKKAHVEQFPKLFGSSGQVWSDLNREAARSFTDFLIRENLDEIRGDFRSIFERDRDLFDSIANTGATLPVEIKGLIQFNLNSCFLEEIATYRGHYVLSRYSRARECMQEASRFHLSLDKREAEEMFREDLQALILSLGEHPVKESFERLDDALQVVDYLGLDIRLPQAQTAFLSALRAAVAREKINLKEALQTIRALSRVARRLKVALNT